MVVKITAIANLAVMIIVAKIAVANLAVATDLVMSLVATKRKFLVVELAMEEFMV